MLAIACTLIATGSEFIIALEGKRVLKIPRRWSWRRLMGRWRARAEADIFLLTARKIAHGNSRVLEGDVYTVDDVVYRPAFVVRQSYFPELHIIRETDLFDGKIRRHVLRMLKKSLHMREDGRAIDLTGMEAVSHFIRALLSGGTLDLGMHNLHWDSDRVVLLDIGLLPIAGWHPLAIINRRIAHLQHELVWAVLQPHLSKTEVQSAAYRLSITELTQQRSGMTGWCTHRLARWLYSISRGLLA